MRKITYFDVEYANSCNKSICQIGIMCEDYETGDPVYPELSIRINPEDGFDEICIKTHGITANQVANEPNFACVWKEIEKYFTNAIVVGHNVASSDLDALVKNLKRYNIDIPEIYYICTLELSKKYVSRFCVENYTLKTLCSYFDIDIENAHDAFDDACACADLFKMLVKEYNVNIDNVVYKYDIKETKEYISFIADPVLRKSISEFYGIIKGFSIDNIISDDEKDYIIKWKNEFLKYVAYKEIKDIINTINKILSDDIVTKEEIIELQLSIQQHLDNVNTSYVTLSTQILNGIIKGITLDGIITEQEVVNLRQWLYNNNYLRGNYPFDQLLSTIENVLSDNIISIEELNIIKELINSLLDPVEKMKTEINDVKNQVVCLSGNFEYGEKNEVEKYIVQRGGIVVSGVSKKINVLIIGKNECLSYSNGTYGTKVKRVMELNEKGCNIKILKESDFFSCVK